MLFWNYWLGHGITIFYFIKTKIFWYYLNLFSWKYLLSYLCWLSTSGFKCQRPNIFSLAKPTREIVHQYVIYRNEDLRPLLIVSTRIDRSDKCDSKDVCNINKSSWEGGNGVKKTTLNTISQKRLDDRWIYHGERKMILNENDLRAIPSS